VNTMDDWFSRMDKFVTILFVEFIRMFLNFHGFPNDSRAIVGCRCKDFGCD
jgi:hypothetical protein